jgi:group I intron endonuclease
MFYLYYIENLKNGNIYIGKAKDPHQRWAMHRCIAFGSKSSYIKSFSYLHAALKKSGVKSFVFNVFASFDTEEECYLAEVDWIQYLISSNVKLYNLSLGGKGVGSGDNHPSKNKCRPPEVREKISLSRKGKCVGSQNPNYGGKVSEQGRLKISAARKGVRHSEATKSKISNTMLSKPLENRNCLKGDHSPNSKLTEANVIEIKLLLNKKSLSCKQIAEMFKVSRATISEIKRGKNWKHIKV